MLDFVFSLKRGNKKEQQIKLKTIKGEDESKKKEIFTRGHPELNQGPLDLQSNALPLSYTPLALIER